MTTAKYALYIIMVACFFGAGGLDLAAKQWKLGVVSIGFGVMNGLIFLWR